MEENNEERDSVGQQPSQQCVPFDSGQVPFKLPENPKTGNTTGEKPFQSTPKHDEKSDLAHKDDSSGNAHSKQYVSFPYKEPSWSGLPHAEYTVEVLKNGTIVSIINLSERPFTVFGRFSTCDVLMEHPSISRYHAVLQYRAIADEHHAKGFYLFDLDSTHGTFLNKMQIRPKSYYHIHVGHIIKFGGSTKLYVLQGPSEDEEEESELTVTQIKQLQRQQLEKLKAEAQQESEESSNSTERSDGIDWGLGEDAVEISQENPFALSTANEELYLEDPKKTLRGWFEREGYELEYDVEEKGFGHFVCRVQLPIDVSSADFVTAEASVKGKKKEAVVACALEACRILDRYGLLRQSHHESRKRKQKNWEEDDYYESDEDTFLDRTGTIEKKREMRKKLVKKDDTVETYDSLGAKLEDVNKEIAVIQEKLSQSRQHAETEMDSCEADTLDAYMTSLKQGEPVDKKTKTKLRLQLAQLQQEQRHLTKMVELARPVSLPSFESRESTKSQSRQETGKPSSKLFAMTGSMKGRASVKIKKVTEKPVTSRRATELDSNTEEEDDEEDEHKDEQQSSTHKEGGGKMQMDISKNLVPTTVAHDATQSARQDTQQTEMIIGPSLPDVKGQDQKLRNAESKRNKPKCKQDDSKCEYDTSHPDYAMWIPPENQSGDGVTSLNAKYGY